MWGSDSGDKWYAIFVKTGEEETVKTYLNHIFPSGFKVVVPKRKLKERKQGIISYIIRVLFPGYVLINGYIGPEQYYSMKRVPGLLRLLCSESGPVEIRHEEIELLGSLVCNSDIIDFSNVLCENGRVQVIDGPLFSLEGLIESVNKRKGRARVRLNFLGEERSIELGISVLKPCY
jgi:transcription termination/antitermination protein NusG